MREEKQTKGDIPAHDVQWESIRKLSTTMAGFVLTPQEHYGFDHWHCDFWFCPRCAGTGKEVKPGSDCGAACIAEGFSFCPHCGCALDWDSWREMEISRIREAALPKRDL